MNQKELGEKMNIKGSSVARLADRLEKEDFIKRIRDPEDRRITNLVLTEKGKEYREKVMPIAQHLNDTLSINISQEEMDIFKGILGKMLKNVKKL